MEAIAEIIRATCDKGDSVMLLQLGDRGTGPLLPTTPNFA